MKPKRDSAADPWWSKPGPELCEFCLHTFQVEAGYYCADCDRPICPVCVLQIRERHSVSCPDCSTTEKL
jgi:DNA-directed RNA polymerase subunit RPC12/RpoP